MKTEHPYAPLLRAIADGERIEVQYSTDEGFAEVDPNIVLGYLHRGHRFASRIKPRTILINQIEVPEPMRVAPEDNSAVFIVDISALRGNFDSYFCKYNQPHDRWLQRGLVHATREAAEAHARALLSFTEVK